MVFLTTANLDKLKNNPGKYAMEDNSKLSAALQHWWIFVANYMVLSYFYRFLLFFLLVAQPIWVSANTITVAAVFPNVLCLMLVYLVGRPVPYWLQVFGSISVFAFQVRYVCTQA